MKYILLTLLITFFCLAGFGFYLNSEIPKSGDKWIGFGVLLIAFGIMPIFIASRYKKSKMGEFLKNQANKTKENSENQ
jgi:mannose/fructose/N-acetylgalactosamine-specific phosphotransferase system component IIC